MWYNTEPMDRVFLSSAYVPFAAWGLLVLTFVWQCRMRIPGKAFIVTFFFAALMMFRGFALFGSSIWRPELPEILIWLWCVAFFGSLLLAVTSTLCIFWRSRMKFILLPTICFGIAAAGVWNGVKIPEVHVVELHDANLPAELDGYRIVQISDIHACGAARRWRTEGIVAKANALNADLICLTGDQTDGTVAQRLHDIEPLRNLRAKDGIFAISGNHEYFYVMDEWRPVYRQLGIRLLENECAFPRPLLALGGVNAFNAKGPDTPDVAKTFAAATNGEYRILLQHRPNPTVENFTTHGVNLQLSGHTHGGFMPILSTLIRDGHAGYLRGVYPINNGHLIVSPGCGPWPALPLRYFDPAQILLIILRRYRSGNEIH